MEKYLVINAGSSSLKFSLYEMPSEELLINGYFEKIGHKDSFWTLKINGEKIKREGYLSNHSDAVMKMIDELLVNKIIDSMDEIKGVGHRVLHGGEIYSDSIEITDKVLEDIIDLTKLGPLHHPGEIAGIKAMIESSKECGGSWDKVFQLVKDKFNVDSETAEKCMKLYW